MTCFFRCISVFVVFFCFVQCDVLNAVVYGSEYAVSILPAVTFPAHDSDNTMLGFGWFKSGFTLEDATTTCTFNSVYPLSGTMNFNGGQLYLLDDFMMSNTSGMVGGAKIIGNTHTVKLCSSIESLSSTYTFQDVVVVLDADISLTGKLIFVGECFLMGSGCDILLDGGSIVVAADSHLTCDNIDFDGVQGRNVACENDSAHISFLDTGWRQIDDFVFDKGSFDCSEYVEFKGTHTFWYDSSQTSTIHSGASWVITDGMTLKVGRKNAVAYVEPIYFDDDTATLHLDNCSLLVTQSGMGLARGAFELDHAVSVDILSSSTVNGLIVGTGNVGEDFSMKLSPATVISLLAGWWVYNNTNASGKLNALSSTSQCVRYADSKFYVQKNWMIPPMVFQLLSGTQSATTVEGATLSYDQTMIVTSSGKAYVTGEDATNVLLLDGNHEIYITEGVEQFPVLVRGTNNSLRGSGGIASPITLQDSDASLSCCLSGLVDANIVMNGGTLQLECDLNLGYDVVLSGTGFVDLSKKNYCFSIRTGHWNDSLEWDGNPGTIKLTEDIELVGTWTFSNDCMLDGGGHVLNLSGGGKLVVDEGSHLLLQGVVIKGIGAESITCFDDASSLGLRDVVWDLSADFTFSTGSIEFIDGCVLQGAYNFFYDSSQTSTIASGSSLSLANDISLWIGRKQATNYVEPLYFVDTTSILQLNNCSYIVTATGMRLTRGKVEFYGAVNLDVQGINPAQGFELGDGSAGHDIYYQYGPGGVLDFRSGWLTYNNYSPHCFIASSEDATVIRRAGTGLFIERNWTYPRMRLRVDVVKDAMLPELVSDGGILTFNNSHMIFKDTEFDITGELIGTSSFRLAGNHSLCMTKGVVPGYLYVSGSDNELCGTGDIIAPIILQDSGSELSCDLNGSFFFNPSLNGGILTLDGDVRLGPGISLMSSGTIDLNSYQMLLSPVVGSWTTDTVWSGTGGIVKLQADVDLGATWTFTNNCVIDGNFCVLDLKSGGALAVAPGGVLTIKNTTLRNVSGSNLQCCAVDSSLILDNVMVECSDDFTFSQGSIKTLNAVDFKGSSSFIYDSVNTSTIAQDSTWSIKNGMTFITGKVNEQNPLYFESNSGSILHFADSSLIVTGSGLQLSAGKITVDGDFIVDSLASSTALGLIFGTGLSDGDMNVAMSSGASINFHSGWLSYNNYLPNRFFATSKNARVNRYGASKTYVKQDWAFPEMILTVTDGQPTTIIESGKTLSYSNVHMIFPNVEFDFTGKQYGDSEFALTGNDSISLSKGTFASYLFVNKNGNQLSGNGVIGGPIIFSDSDSIITSYYTGVLLYDVVLAGGTIILGNDLLLGSATTITQTGTIILDDHRCRFGFEDQTWTSTLEWVSGTLELNSYVTLNGTWTLQGNTIVQGNGNVLDLNKTGKLVIADGANVAFRNLKICGITSEQIQCLGGTSSLTLDSLVWDQAGDYVFTQGHLNIMHDVIMKGSSIFAYQSGQTSLILSESSLCFDQGFTFSYDPTTVASKELLLFEDSSATLILDGATLYVTVTGLTLKNGSIEIIHNSTISSEVQTIFDSDGNTLLLDEGITLGGGTGLDDMELLFDGSTVLILAHGSLCYNNTATSSLRMQNVSSVLSINSGTALKLYQSMDIGAGLVVFSDGATLVCATGKSLVGSIQPLGRLNRVNVA
jgi:hypothetical protein